MKQDKSEMMIEKYMNGEITPLKWFLFSNGMTVAELSKATGINKKTLDDYVCGSRDIRNIGLQKGLNISLVLKINPFDLIENKKGPRQ